MKCIAILFCIAAIAVVTKAASISGGASIDKNSAAAGGRLVFPRIPGINAPLSSLFPSRQTSTSRPSSTTSSRPISTTSSSSSSSSTSSISTSRPSSTTGNGSDDNSSSISTTSSSGSSSLLSNVAELFDVPDPASLIPDLSSLGNTSDLEIPAIPGLPDISQLPKIPGLSDAIEEAREHVQTALQLGNDMTSGIQQAVQEAFESDDPTSAIRTIVKTIIDAYLTVAANCPLMIVGSRVIQEGIRLALEVAKSATNVIFGTTSASV